MINCFEAGNVHHSNLYYFLVKFIELLFLMIKSSINSIIHYKVDLISAFRRQEQPDLRQNSVNRDTIQLSCLNRPQGVTTYSGSPAKISISPREILVQETQL